jgi:ABC-type ATPase involved in cell division
MTFDLREATVVYDAIPALEAATCTFDGGGIHVITGATGAGKTTLLRLLYADTVPTSGDVIIDGTSTRRMSAKAVRNVRRRMGIVQQHGRLMGDLTVYGNVIMPLAVRGLSRTDANKRCLEVLADLNVSYVRHKLPHQLSGGERHLVALARALAGQPEVLIADEPTGTLDPSTTSSVAAYLVSVAASGTTIILSTHSQSLLSSLQGATVYSVSDGRLRRG